VAARRQILLYTLILVPLGIAPWALGYAGLLYGLTAMATGGLMLLLAGMIWRERRPKDGAARKMFAFSILYLFLLFAALLVNNGWGGLIG
jgi:protoheme IX farnesyltransferase